MTNKTPMAPSVASVADTAPVTPSHKSPSVWVWLALAVFTGVLGLGGGYYWGHAVGQSQIPTPQGRPFGPMGGSEWSGEPPLESATDVEITPPSVVAVAATTDFSGAKVTVIDLSVLPPTLPEATWQGQELVIEAQAGQQYSLTGDLGGQVTFVASAPLEVELNDVSITNDTGPALVFKNPELSTVTLRAESNNVLTDGGENEDYDAALFSVGPLAINGAGTLTATGNYQEGIASDANLIIQNGQLVITAADDGLNAQSDISINGGQVIVSAAGDGLDSNGTLNITGGVVFTQGSLADASGGLDADGAIVFSGGVVVATGSQNAWPQNQTSQKFLVVNLNQTLAAGTGLTLTTSDQQALVKVILSQDARQLVFSLPQIQVDTDYHVYASTGEPAVAAITLSPIGTDGGTLLTTVNTAASASQTRGRPVGSRPPGADMPGTNI